MNRFVSIFRSRVSSPALIIYKPKDAGVFSYRSGAHYRQDNNISFFAYAIERSMPRRILEFVLTPRSRHLHYAEEKALIDDVLMFRTR